MQTLIIYPQKNVAAMIAARLSKSKGIEYAVTKVTTGFQVFPVVKVEPKKPAAVPTLLQNSEAAAKVLNGAYCTLKVRFRGESPKYIDAWIDGKPVSFGKTSLINWKIETPEGEAVKWVELTVPKAMAKKRGLLAV